MESRPRNKVSIRVNLRANKPSSQHFPKTTSKAQIQPVKATPKALLLNASSIRKSKPAAPKKSLGSQTLSCFSLTASRLDCSNARAGGAEQDAMPKLMTPAEALKQFGRFLTSFERKEILGYSQVYFLGLRADKISPDSKQENFGYDKEGIYQVPYHDHIAYQYEILRKIGEGTFSQVFLAYDHRHHKKVALKVIKNQHHFYEQSLREIEILRGLSKNCKTTLRSVELLDRFSFRKHRVLVFPHLQESLHQHLKAKNGSGLEFAEALAIGHQLAQALCQIHAKKVIHCDLKPSNVMFALAQQKGLTLIDFGAASVENHTSYQYVQSRYYRAPEVILGRVYTCAIDMWSYGCVLIELVLGVPLFRGADSHRQLLSIMEFLGYPSVAVLQQSPKRKLFFTRFDQVIQKEGSSPPGSRQLEEVLGHFPSQFLDLIRKCLCWDPASRLTAADAIKHPVFNEVRCARHYTRVSLT